MGIHGLTKLIADHAPSALREAPISSFFGRKVAIDASMCIYQFLIAVRTEGSNGSAGLNLTNSKGETTSHLMGMFYRTIRMMEYGIKPIFVFDGKPPHLKGGQLAKRLDRREEAQVLAKKAEEDGDQVTLDKMTRRLVKAIKKHSDECKQLLTLMGIPVVQAPCEAEAQCAQLVKDGLAYAAGSEDMDTLTFGSHILLRHLTFSEARKMPIVEIHLKEILSSLSIKIEGFIDLCILLGCDYTDSIRGIGPMRAVQLIKEHGSIENILAVPGLVGKPGGGGSDGEGNKEDGTSCSKYQEPAEFPYKEARDLFINPDVIRASDTAIAPFKWALPDVEGVVKFMVEENGFDEKRIRSGLDKLIKSRGASTQGRLDSFFTITPNQTPKKTVLSSSKGVNGAKKKKAKISK